MLFRFKNAIADIDIETTRNFYRQHDMINDCACDGCENYRQWADTKCSPELREQFRKFGIEDMKVIREILLPGYFDDNYGGVDCHGWYDVVGKILNESDIVPEDVLHPAEPLELSIYEDDCLTSPKFPRPVLQISIDGFIPWVLDTDVQEFL
ncbi:MAG: hypothetical protein IJ644_03505 [Oscillospiraceae bacterium]|nr:hypothetical protein [Oscillospiraceae bacterium]